MLETYLLDFLFLLFFQNRLIGKFQQETMSVGFVHNVFFSGMADCN